MFTLINGDTVKVSTAKADLQSASVKVRDAMLAERASALTIGRTLASVKASGLAGILLSADDRKDLNGSKYRSAFNAWTESLGIDKVARSRYLNHAATVDGLLADGIEGADKASAHLARTLVKAAKAETEADKASGIDEPKVSKPSTIVETMKAEGLPLTAESVKNRFIGDPPTGKNREAPKVRTVGSIIEDILTAADSDASVDFGTVSVDDIDRAADILQVWASNAHALLETDAA